MMWYGGQPIWGWRSSPAEQWHHGDMVHAFGTPNVRSVSITASAAISGQQVIDLQTHGYISLVSKTRELEGDAYLFVPLELVGTGLVSGQRRFPLPYHLLRTVMRSLPQIP